MKLLIVFALFGITSSAFATEPAFCDPAKFKNYEIRYTGHAPSNLHVYKLGNVTVAGMAIGHSNMKDMTDLARAYSGVAASEKYCTWYFNDANDEAKTTFVWRYVPRPTGSDYTKMGNTFMSVLGNEFDQAPINFVNCAVQAGYIGMGCDGMKHRGPSVFAMLLGYAGCTPVHAATIATQIWGSNGITVEMRTALAQRAVAVAAAHPELANQIRTVMMK